MDKYRKAIKTTISVYKQNPQLKSHILSTLKLTIKNTPKEDTPILLNFIENLTQVLASIGFQKANSSLKIEPKKQLDLSFIVYKCAEFKDIDIYANQQEKEAFSVFAWIQFYFLIAKGKIYPKNTVSKKKEWVQLLDQINGNCKYVHQHTMQEISIYMPSAKKQQISLL